MNCKNISTTTPVLYPNTNNKQQHQKYQVCSHRDSALHRAAILMALTFSLEDSFRKYKIGHRSYSLCLGIRFILCSECLYSDLSALDLLDFRSTLAPTFHFRTQEAWNSTLKIPNSSHSQFQVICLTDTTFFPTKSYAQCRVYFFIQIIIRMISWVLTGRRWILCDFLHMQKIPKHTRYFCFALFFSASIFIDHEIQAYVNCTSHSNDLRDHLRFHSRLQHYHYRTWDSIYVHCLNI